MNTAHIKYDKLRYKEYITYKKDKFVNDFGYTLLDFLYDDVKQRYYDIIKDSNKTNHKEIFKQIYALFNDDCSLVVKLFYTYEFNRWLEESNLNDYSGTLKKLDTKNKTKSYIVISNEKPFMSERDKKIRLLLDEIENRQHIYSLILEFCSIDTATDSNNYYNRYVNKFIYASKKLLGNLSKPNVTFDYNVTMISKNKITLDELNKSYNEYNSQFIYDTNPIDDFYYICHSADDYFITVMFQLLDRHYIISKCNNCNKLFVPFRNNTALYCDRKSPQNPNKTCKEFEGAKPKGLNTLYRKIYQKKFARVSRNKTDYTLKNDFEKWKEKAQKTKAKYDSGKITDDEYKEWLLKNDK